MPSANARAKRFAADRGSGSPGDRPVTMANDPLDQLVGRAKLGYFSLPSAILAGHTVTCLPSCH